MKAKNKRRLIGAGALTLATAAAAGASYALTKYMMGMAMDRNKPKSIVDEEKTREIIRGNTYLEDFLKAIGAASERLKQQPTRRVEIESQDGIRLVGHLWNCERPERIVLAMHGWRSSWDQDFGMIADFWHENRCAVLFAEQRGQNESGGDYMGFGMLERYDCLDWVRWLNGEFSQQLPIYLAGVSMGAATVLMAADLPLPDNVKGIAADCGYTSPQAIWKHVTNNNFHLFYGVRSTAIQDLCQQKINMGPEDCSTVESLQNTKIPVFLAHGTDDSFVPVEMTYENYKACAGPKKLLIVPGADHGMSYYLAKDEYEHRVREFWQMCEASGQD